MWKYKFLVIYLYIFGYLWEPNTKIWWIFHFFSWDNLNPQNHFIFKFLIFSFQWKFSSKKEKKTFNSSFVQLSCGIGVWADA
jgi:hypothetical protein